MNLNIFNKIKDNYSETPAYIRTHIGAQQTQILASMFDMAYIAATAEDAYVLPQPIKFASEHRSQQKLEEYNKKYETDVDYTRKQFKKNLKISHALDDRIKSRTVLFGMIREIYPDFALDYTKKMSPQDLEAYLASKKLLKRHIGVQVQPLYDAKTTSHEIFSNYCDSISQVIDTKEFSKACQIEDAFMLRELDIFFEKYNALSAKEQQQFSSTKITTSKGNVVSAIKLAHLLRDSRVTRLQKHAQIEGLYKKMDSKPFIKLDIDEKDDEKFYNR